MLVLFEKKGAGLVKTDIPLKKIMTAACLAILQERGFVKVAQLIPRPPFTAEAFTSEEVTDLFPSDQIEYRAIYHNHNLIGAYKL